MAGIKPKLFSVWTGKRRFQLPEKYRFLSVLGEGGFGHVLKCEDRQTKRKVAVKIPKSKRKNSEVGLFDYFDVHSCKKILLSEVP